MKYGKWTRCLVVQNYRGIVSALRQAGNFGRDAQPNAVTAIELETETFPFSVDIENATDFILAPSFDFFAS